MNKTDSEIVQDWKKNESDKMNEICSLILEQEHSVQDYLADTVAALCDLTTQDMMTKKGSLHCNHARWLFWYAYRYMTNDTFEHISQFTARYGYKYSLQGITAAVNKMSNLIMSDTVWTTRWNKVKRIIKLRDRVNELDFQEAEEQALPSDMVYINIPKELKNKVVINYN